MKLKRVLLADDHSYIRLGIATILKAEYPALHILQVMDWGSLVKEVIHQKWDLVITDLDMPGRGGLESLEQIKKVRPSLPVLVFSMFSADIYAVRVLRAGAMGFMHKHTTPDEFIKVIRHICSGKKYITPDVAEKLLDHSMETECRLHTLLTNSEFEVFKLLALGKKNAFIAEAISVAMSTVNSYRRQILLKLNLDSNAAITRYALKLNVILDLKETLAEE